MPEDRLERRRLRAAGGHGVPQRVGLAAPRGGTNYPVTESRSGRTAETVNRRAEKVHGEYLSKARDLDVKHYAHIPDPALRPVAQRLRGERDEARERGQPIRTGGVYRLLEQLRDRLARARTLHALLTEQAVHEEAEHSRRPARPDELEELPLRSSGARRVGERRDEALELVLVEQPRCLRHRREA